MLKSRNEARAITNRLHQRKVQPLVWFYKIPDDSIWKKPFDVVWCVNGKATAIEFKFCDLKKKIPDAIWAFKRLEPHQVVNLNNFKVAWWDVSVIVYNKEDKRYYSFDRSNICDAVWEDEINKFYILLKNDGRVTAWGKNDNWK